MRNKKSLWLLKGEVFLKPALREATITHYEFLIKRQRLLSAIVDRAGDFRFQVLTADDAVNVAVLEQKLARLESFRQGGLDRGLDRAGTGKTDQRFRLGKGDVLLLNYK